MGKAEEVTAVLVSRLGSMSFQHLGKVHDFKTALMRTLDFIILSLVLQFHISIKFCSRGRESYYQKSPIRPNPTASSRVSLSFAHWKRRLAAKEQSRLVPPWADSPLGQDTDSEMHPNLHCDIFWLQSVSHYNIKTLNIAVGNFQFLKKQPITILNSKLKVLITYPLHKPIFELMELQWVFTPQWTRG